MTSDNGAADGNGGGDGEVPPPNIIKVEDYAAFDLATVEPEWPPDLSFGAELLERPEGVALSRLDSDEITDHDGDGVLVGESVADLSYLIAELGGRHGQLRVRDLVFNHSLSVEFTTLAQPEAALLGPTTREQRGAERLHEVLACRDLATLRMLLHDTNDTFSGRLEGLLLRLFERHAVLDLQTPAQRPVRLRAERAAVLYNSLRTLTPLPTTHQRWPCRLVGATLDTRDFKLRLAEPWEGRRVIEGKFKEGLESAIESLFNQSVLAGVRVEGERRGVRSAHLRYTLEWIAPIPQLPLGNA